MYILKTNTATRIAVGPLVDPTDGKTAETGLTVTDLSVQLYQIKNDGNAVVRTQFAPTASGGNNDMALVASSTDGMYDLELTAAQLNWLGNGRISFYDVDGFLVHWIDIQVVSASHFDWIFGSTIPDVNVTKVSGTAQTAKDIGAIVDKLDTALELDGAVYRFTANALENLPLTGVGTGPTPKTYTITVDGVPCADVLVIMSTDEAGTFPIHSGRTNALGKITFYPDLPAGTKVYLWRYKTGVSFVNPDEEQI